MKYTPHPQLIEDTAEQAFQCEITKISFSGQKCVNPQLINDFPCDSADKESACKAGDLGLIPQWGRFLGERKGCPLQYSGLENFMDCIVHGVTKSWTWLRDFHFRNENYHFKFFFPLKMYYNLKNFKTNSEQLQCLSQLCNQIAINDKMLQLLNTPVREMFRNSIWAEQVI